MKEGRGERDGELVRAQCYNTGIRLPPSPHCPCQSQSSPSTIAVLNAGKHRTSIHTCVAIPVHSIAVRHTHAHTPINHRVNHALAETLDLDELLPRSVCILIC